MKKMRLYVISHTHWDREWYQTFQQYRYRLVRMLDDLLDTLDLVPAYQVFHLDGQTLPLEDYLAVRPENEARLRARIAEGRIVIGPWYVMPDEFLVSGESLVKNLQTGFRICGNYGAEPFANGYVTDIFGHNSQLPQLLNGFGITAATLYRGIGDYPKDAFLWQSPDGSRVKVCKLDCDRSYSNFYFAVRWPYEGGEIDPDDAVRRMQALIDRARRSAASDAIVMMDGVDHIDAEPRLPGLLRLFSERIPDVEFLHANLEDYFQELDGVQLEVVEGSLYYLGREGVNNQLLKNVLSSMVHIKQQNDGCERALQCFAEPLNAFSAVWQACAFPPLGRDEYSLSPRRVYLDEAWKLLLQNHPHDSICGCSLPDVHRDNEYRYRQARQMAGLAAEDALDQIARNIAVPVRKDRHTLVYNPSQLPVHGTVIVDLLLPEGNDENLRWYDASGNPLDMQLLEEKPHTLCKHGLRQLVSFERGRRARAAVELDIPPFGYTVIACEQLPQRHIDRAAHSYGFVDYHSPRRLAGSLMTGTNRVDNGVLEVTIQPDGTLNVRVKETGREYRGLLRFEDGADAGDGWNYRKPAFDRKLYSGEQCRLEVLSDGPLVCELEIVHCMALPIRLEGAHRAETRIRQELRTRVTILRGEGRLEFETLLDNQAEDHRLRVLFPTELGADEFYTKTPYDMCLWPVTAADTHDFIEAETYVHPSQGILYIRGEDAGFSLYSKGLYEAEVTDCKEQAVALTLFRAFARVSGTSESGDAQMKRELRFEYAASFTDESPSAALLHGEQYRAGRMTRLFTPASGAAALEAYGSFLKVHAGEKLVSYIAQDSPDGAPDTRTLQVRLYDVSGHAEEAELETPLPIRKARLVDFRGIELGELTPVGNHVRVPCGAHQIVTAALTF